MKRLLLTLGIGIIFSNTLFTQEIPTVMPPSPNAASLGQYGDIPVNNYTGVPSITIPLYNIKSGKIELPISLSYHASGINIAKEASWVGLGWSLSSGGVITRQVKGLDDFKSGIGHINYQELPEKDYNSYNPNYTGFLGILNEENAATYEQLQFYHNGTRDAQPDIFNYNFFGYSGKLVFKKQGGTGGVYTATAIDQNNLDFQYDRNIERWIVTDEKGWKYYFATTEVSRNRGSSSVIPKQIDPYSSWSEPTITSWFIDRVETPNNDFIDFIYGDGGRFRTPVGYVEQVSHDFHVDVSLNNRPKVNGDPGLVIADANFGYTDGYSAGGAPAQSTYNNFVSETQEVVLQRINFNNGYLQFNSLSGNDRIAYDTDKRRLLNNISVKKLNGSEIKNIWFNTSYFRDDKLNSQDEGLFLRLRLDEVREDYPKDGGGVVSKPSYKFTYDETPLPAKNDILSIDNWGYYNGANNENILGYDFINFPSGDYGNGTYLHKREPTQGNTSVPLFTHIGNQNEDYVKIFMNGANRDVGEDYIQAGVLKSIQYPTGAITKFEYEPNDHFRIGEYKNDFENHLVTSDGTDEKNFTLEKGSFVFLEFDFLHPQHDNPGYDGFINDMYAALEKNDGSPIIRFEPEYSDVIDQESQGIHTYEMKSYVVLFLKPGTYSIKSQEDPAHFYLGFSLRAKVLNRMSTNKKMAGGLRIKDIKNYNNQYDLYPDTFKSFRYEENGKSTGRLLSPVQSFYNETELILRRGSSSDLCCFLGSIVHPIGGTYPNRIHRGTSSFVPMGNSNNGNIVGYGKVFVSNKDFEGNTLGESIYEYKNNVDETRGLFFPGIPNYAFLENGQLTQETHKNEAGNTVKTKSIIYSEGISERIEGLVTKRPSRYYNVTITGGISEARLFLMARYYDIDMKWLYPYQEVESIYDESGLNPITTVKNYKYENSLHKLLTERTTSNSKGEESKVNFFYPDDVTNYNVLGGGDLTALEFDNINNLKSPDIANPESLRKISEPVQVETSVNGITNIVRTSFHSDQELSLPSAQSTLKGTVVLGEVELQERVLFNRYDGNGNYLEIQKVNGPVVSYFWGYNKEYPIAKIENASYDQIASALGTNLSNLESYDENDLSTLNSLRNLLPEAMVTSYTYEPLIGIKTITDPRDYTIFYEYDEFNRLKEVRDADNNLVTDYQYHYKSH